jgi:mono/diheme cytochrome c family protein
MLKRLTLAVILSMLSAVAFPLPTAFAQNVSELYTLKCAGCHGTSGNGDGPSGQMLTPSPRPFRSALHGQSDEWITEIIKGGGGAVGLSPAMPAQPGLSEAQINSLVQYVRKLGS